MTTQKSKDDKNQGSGRNQGDTGRSGGTHKNKDTATHKKEGSQDQNKKHA